MYKKFDGIKIFGRSLLILSRKSFYVCFPFEQECLQYSVKNSLMLLILTPRPTLPKEIQKYKIHTKYYQVDAFLHFSRKTAMPTGRCLRKTQNELFFSSGHGAKKDSVLS